MQAQAYEGYFENGSFYPLDKIAQIKGKRRAVVTIFEEQLDRQETPSIGYEHQREEADEEEKARRIMWLEKLESAIRMSADEDFPLIRRSQNMNSQLNLID